MEEPVNDAAVRATLDRDVLGPLFTAHNPARTSRLPAVVLRNRRARARSRLLDALASRGTDTVPAALQDEVAALVIAWAAADFADAFPDVEALEIRCAREAEERAGTTQEAREANLRARIIKQYDAIEIRGLQVGQRVYQPLDVAYVPLNLHPVTRLPDLLNEDGTFSLDARLTEAINPETLHLLHQRLQGNTDVPQPEPQDRSARALVAATPRVLITGAPGSGKSTLCAFLAIETARGRLLDGRLPLVVPVRSLSGGLTLAEVARLNHTDEAFVSAILDRAVIFIDGLDEAARPDPLWAVLQDWAARYPDTHLVLTSRPAAVKDAPLSGFSELAVSPLQADEVAVFIDRWCLAAEVSVKRDRGLAEDAAHKAAGDLKARLASSRPIRDLATNPLMCSVLCVVHRFMGQRIPERRAVLYEACTNVLLYEWDRARLPAGSTVGKLDAGQKRDLLGDLAYWMHKQKLAEVGEEVVLKRFKSRLPRLGLSRGDASRVIADIRDRSGVLIERSPGQFAFSHLAFQEYLTARHLNGRGLVKPLLDGAMEPWWAEVIILSAGLPGARPARLIRGLLKLEPADAPGRAALLAYHCVQSASEVPVKLREEVAQRTEYENLLLQTLNSNLSDLFEPIISSTFTTSQNTEQLLFVSCAAIQRSDTDFDNEIIHVLKKVTKRHVQSIFNQILAQSMSGEALYLYFLMLRLHMMENRVRSTVILEKPKNIHVENAFMLTVATYINSIILGRADLTDHFIISTLRYLRSIYAEYTGSPLPSDFLPHLQAAAARAAASDSPESVTPESPEESPPSGQ